MNFFEKFFKPEPKKEKKPAKHPRSPYRELEEQPETEDFGKIVKRFEKRMRIVSVEYAKEILGAENVLGPEEVEKTFGVHLEEIPSIPFSAEELERAKEMGQILVLRVDRTDDGKPMSLETMNAIFIKKWEKKKKGGLLDTASGWRDWAIGEKDFVEVAPRSGWALVSKNLLPNSTSKNYIEQPEVIINALREKVFKDIEVPEEYEKAIREFEANKERLTKLMSENRKQATKELSELKINQLTRQSAQEMIYDSAMYYNVRGKHLLSNGYTWSNSRPRIGLLVYLGYFGAEGVRGGTWGPAHHHVDVGVSLSRRC